MIYCREGMAELARRSLGEGGLFGIQLNLAMEGLIGNYQAFLCLGWGF